MQLSTCKRKECHIALENNFFITKMKKIGKVEFFAELIFAIGKIWKIVRN